jgi:hypothetical protein
LPLLIGRIDQSSNRILHNASSKVNVAVNYPRTNDSMKIPTYYSDDSVVRIGKSTTP